MIAMYSGGHAASAYGTRAFLRSSSSGTRGCAWVPWSLWLLTCTSGRAVSQFAQPGCRAEVHKQEVSGKAAVEGLQQVVGCAKVSIVAC